MKILSKAGFGLALLAGAGLTGAAHAQTTFPGTNLSVTEQTSGPSSGLFLYTYAVTPTVNTNMITFSFTDPNVSLSGTPAGALNFVLPTSAGNFVNFSLTGGVLKAGTTETVKFVSSDAPGGFLNTATTGSFAGSAGLATNITAPSAPVPEASTTASLGLLLMLGMGGLVLAARKKAQASA